MKAVLPLLVLLLASACSISRHVVPIPEGTRIRTLYVMENPDLHMEGFVPELVRQIEERGIPVETYSGGRPPEAVHHMTVTANWQWDLAMYLSYFHARVFEDQVEIGSIEYDARSGGGNMGKFGKTADKVRPLVDRLFAGVVGPTAGAEAGG